MSQLRTVEMMLSTHQMTAQGSTGIMAYLRLHEIAPFVVVLG
jgi:hypothetical protein